MIHCANHVQNLVLVATLVRHNVGHQPDYPTNTDCMDTLCTHPVVLNLIQELLDLRRSTSHVHCSLGQIATDPLCRGFLSFAQNDQLESMNVHVHFHVQHFHTSY